MVIPMLSFKYLLEVEEIKNKINIKIGKRIKINRFKFAKMKKFNSLTLSNSTKYKKLKFLKAITLKLHSKPDKFLSQKASQFLFNYSKFLLIYQFFIIFIQNIIFSFRLIYDYILGEVLY